MIPEEAPFSHIDKGLQDLRSRLKESSPKHADAFSLERLDEQLFIWISENEDLRTLLTPFIELETLLFRPVFRHLLALFGNRANLTGNWLDNKIDDSYLRDLKVIDDQANDGLAIVSECLKDYRNARLTLSDAAVELRNLGMLNVLLPHIEEKNRRVLARNNIWEIRAFRRITSLFEQIKLMQSELTSKTRREHLLAEIKNATQAEMPALIAKWKNRVESAKDKILKSEAEDFLRICNERYEAD